MNPSANPGSWTRERWAKVAIMVLFLMLVRTLSEYFRLKLTMHGLFYEQTGEPYVAGALAIAVSCWIAVGCFFLRKYTAVIAISVVTVIVMLIYKVCAIGF